MRTSVTAATPLCAAAMGALRSFYVWRILY